METTKKPSALCPAGIDGNLSVASSVQVVESTVTEAIDDLDELADLDF